MLSVYDILLFFISIIWRRRRLEKIAHRHIIYVPSVAFHVPSAISATIIDVAQLINSIISNGPQRRGCDASHSLIQSSSVASFVSVRFFVSAFPCGATPATAASDVAAGFRARFQEPSLHSSGRLAVFSGQLYVVVHSRRRCLFRLCPARRCCCCSCYYRHC